MEKKKSILLTVVAVATLITLVVGATFAYFQAQGGTAASTDVRVTTYTTDLLTFTTGDDIAIYADQSNFANGLGNQSGTSFAKAHLLANNKTNKASANYYVYLYIPDNSFVYTQDDSTPELLLQVTNPDGVAVTSIDGLDYKTVTDGKGQTIKGFDITTKLGMLTLVNNHEISATPETQETWNINVVFVNLDADQNANTGKNFSSQLIITKDNYDEYTPAMVHTINTNVEDSNLTVSVNASEGTEGIAKYYYALKENNTVAMNSTSKATRLSNTIAVNDLEYIESDSSTYTFTNINASSNYEVYTYVVDNKKTTSNIYNSKVNGDLVVLPYISNVEVTDKTSAGLTVSVTATAGTNAINKYYYSIDNGETYVESTSSTYTFSNLTNKTTYNIKVKVSDINDNYSYEFIFSKTFLYTLANWVVNQYTGTQGENNLYYHDSTLENGAGDNSYRYAGAHDEVNNFVCFGSDAETCPDDNLYRIIGVFGDQVKLIKWDYATTALLGTDGDSNEECSANTHCVSGIDNGYYKGSNTSANIGAYWWNYDSTTYGTNTWSASKLNTVNLNTNFLKNIGKEWSSKIADTTWKVGGNKYNNIYKKTASVAYTNEFTSPVVNTTETKQIGLMYTSDYGFAASPSAWTTTLYNYDSSSVTSVNWMYMGLNEWTLVRASDNTNNAFIITYEGYVDSNGVGHLYTARGVRPVFYLKSFVTYDSGSGVKSDPVRLN